MNTASYQNTSEQHHFQEATDRRAYQDWPGRQKFYNDGKFVLQGTWLGAIRTVLLILALEGLFLGLVARRLNSPWHIIVMSTSCVLVPCLSCCTQGWYFNWNRDILSGGATLCLLSIAYLMQTMLTDPGMLPKLEASEAYRRMQLSRERDVLVGERWVKIRYDDTYHIYRPPRAHHCRVLNVVIARFDHYCPWTGTAIGLRNYRPFVLFLLFCTLSTMHGIAFCVLHIIHHVRETGQESSPDPGGIQGVAEDPTQPERRSTTSSLLEILPTPIMLIVLAAFLFAVGGLLCFHIYLIARGMTTYESVEGAGAIYSEGLSRNCWNVWFAPTPAPFVDFSQPTSTASQQQLPEIVAMHNPQHSSRNVGVAGQSLPEHLQQQLNSNYPVTVGVGV